MPDSASPRPAIGPPASDTMWTVTNPPGKQVTDCAMGYQDLKASKKFNYEGASGPMDFNEHNNVFGGFDAVKSDASSNVSVVTTITATDLSSY